MEQKRQKGNILAFLLTKEDFEFIDGYCDRNGIVEGYGDRIKLYLFINAYKHHFSKEVQDDK